MSGFDFFGPHSRPVWPRRGTFPTGRAGGVANGGLGQQPSLVNIDLAGNAAEHCCPAALQRLALSHSRQRAGICNSWDRQTNKYEYFV